MARHFFDEASLRVLLRPESWRLVSSFCRPEAAAVNHDAHDRWLKTHSHTHPSREVLLALRGKVRYGKQGQIYACSPGTVLVFDAFEPHDAGYPSWSANFLHLWLNLLEKQCMIHVVGRDARLQLRSAEAVQTAVMPPQAVNFHPDFWAELRAEGALTGRLARIKLLAVVSLIAAQAVASGCETQGEEEQSWGDSFQAEVITAIGGHISETAGKGLTLDNLARLAGYSKFHFHRLFKKHTGQSIHQYIDGCRLKKVRALQQAGASPRQIALALGFSCRATFARWYKQQR